MDASIEGGLKQDGHSGSVGFLEFVQSPDYVLTKPIEIYVQYEQGYQQWVASFCQAAISAGGETVHDAIEELRRLLLFVYERWKTGRDLPPPWQDYSPVLLGALEKHFARKRSDG